MLLTVGSMTSTATTEARSDRPMPPPTGRIDEARAEQLRAANINPRTGLATDYLNHFNEAIMLLEMVPDMPECAEDFLTWTPRSYAEHFWASNFKARDNFDNLTATMTSILTAVGQAMREAQQDKTRATLAEQATAWVKPLVALAGGVINGNAENDVEAVMSN